MIFDTRYRLSNSYLCEYNAHGKTTALRLCRTRQSLGPFFSDFRRQIVPNCHGQPNIKYYFFISLALFAWSECSCPTGATAKLNGELTLPSNGEIIINQFLQFSNSNAFRFSSGLTSIHNRTMFFFLLFISPELPETKIVSLYWYGCVAVDRLANSCDRTDIVVAV